MSNASPTAGAKPRILPVFPLPDTVLFPRTTLPLHVFEPRYRAMVRDVSAGEGLIVVSLVSGDGFVELGTVGRVRELEPLADGRFNLRLEGLERVSLARVPADTPYAQVQVQSRPERAGTEDASVIAAARLELLASYCALHRMILEREMIVLQQDLPFEFVVNMACSSLPIEAALRQQLLGEDTLLDRQRLGLEYFSRVIEMLSWLRAMKNASGSMKN